MIFVQRLQKETGLEGEFRELVVFNGSSENWQAGLSGEQLRWKNLLDKQNGSLILSISQSLIKLHMNEQVQEYENVCYLPNWQSLNCTVFRERVVCTYLEQNF